MSLALKGVVAACTACRPRHVPRSNRRSPISAATARRAAPRGVALRAVLAQAGQTAAAGPSTVTVTFSINHQLKFGQQMVLVGDVEQLGGWQLEQATTMTWSEGDDWRASLELPAGAHLEYKFVIIEDGCVPIWETCANRTWIAEARTATLSCSWDSLEVAATTSWSADAEDDDGGPLLHLPPAYKPAQSVTASFGNGNSSAARQALANRRKAVSAVNGAVAAASGAAAAAEAVVAAAEAAAAAVAEAVAAAEAVVQELSAAGSSAALKDDGATFSAEQLAFLQRKRSVSPGANGAATAVITRSPPPQQTAAAAAEAVLAATTAAAGAAAKVVAAAESVAAELTGSTAGTNGSSAQVNGQHAAALAQPSGNYSPEQLEFMRRKLNAIQAQPSAVKPAPAASASNGAAPAGNFSPEQLEFMRRKAAGTQQQPSSSPAPRPRSRSPQPNGAASKPQYSPEQLAFLKRAGKL